MFKSIMTIIAVAAMICMSAVIVQAHVSMKFPCGRYQSAPGCPAPPSGQSVDLALNGPIGTNTSIISPICKHTVPYTTRTQIRAGSTIDTKYTIEAFHEGGHCQWALSYDNGATWAVFKTLIRNCLRGARNGNEFTIPVQIPEGAPPGKATFMWLWNNSQQGRHLYSNCADIEITGGTVGGSVKGVVPLFANYGPGSFFFPEFFKPNDDDRSFIFNTRRSITISANGKRRCRTRRSCRRHSGH